MSSTAFTLYLGLLIFGVLFFGAIHFWVYTIVFLGIIAASLLMLAKEIARAYDRDKKEGARPRIRWIRSGATPLFLFFVAFLILQMLPLPSEFLALLSPEASIAGKMSLSAASMLDPASLAEGWNTLSPYIFPVRMSLVRWIVYGLFFFGLISCLDSRKRIETAVVAILLLCSLDALYGIMQTYSGNSHIWWYRNEKYMRDVCGTYLNRNHFAGLMEMGIALAIAYAATLTGGEKNHEPPQHAQSFRKRLLNFFSESNRTLRRFLVIFAGGVLGVALFLSASRGGIIATTGALLLMGLLFTSRKSERRKGGLILAFCGISLIYSLHAGMDYTVGRFELLDRDVVDRWVMSEKTVDLFRDYAYTGAGMGNFRYAYGKYQDVRQKNLYMDYAHNDYAQFLAEAGIAGAALLIIGMGWYLAQTFRRWRARNDSFAVCLGIVPFGTLAAIGIHSISDYNLHRPANVLVLIAVMAIGYAALNLKDRHRRSPVEYPQRLIPLWPWGVMILACVVSAILWSGIWTIRHFVAEAHCSTEYNVTLNLEQNPSAEDIRTAIAWDPANAAYHHKLALALKADRDRRMQQPTPDTEGWKRSHGPIIAALERSIRLNPLNPQMHVHLGWEYSYRFDQPDHTTRWLPAADICMERAAWFGGDWVQYPQIHYDMGNYWTMRSKTLQPADPRCAVSLTRAVWHYRKGMELTQAKSLPADVKGYIRNFYPDERHLLGLL